MGVLNSEKMTKERDKKFYNYLHRLVEAKKVKEKERFNGAKLLREFVLDKDSIVS